MLGEQPVNTDNRRIVGKIQPGRIVGEARWRRAQPQSHRELHWHKMASRYITGCHGTAKCSVQRTLGHYGKVREINVSIHSQ